MLDDRPALLPATASGTSEARIPRRLGFVGWIAATAVCALNVYAVRDTMFAPLAQSDAPSSAWETRTTPGKTTVPLAAVASGTHHMFVDHDTGHLSGTSDAAIDTGNGNATATGTTVPDADRRTPDNVPVSGASVDANPADAHVPATAPTAAGGGTAPGATADSSTSSSPSTSTPDTLGGHGANSGSGNGSGGAGNHSGSP
jgi:hypothetical protein